MPEASPSDVRVEIDTGLDDSDITAILDRVEREWQREYQSDAFEDAQHIQDFEATFAALRIAEGRDRRASSHSFTGESTTYEEDEIAALRKRVRRDDPGDTFGRASNIRLDNDRHISTVE